MSNTFYVDPIVEASKYDIAVLADITSSKLGDGEIGMITNDDSSVTIYIKPNQSLERQRFTIAHELGHYVCGHLQGNTTKFRDTTKSYSPDNYDLSEYQANTYAAELLMPKSKVDFLINEQGVATIAELAQALVVSQQAMTIRLKNLGWIS